MQRWLGTAACTAIALLVASAGCLDSDSPSAVRAPVSHHPELPLRVSQGGRFLEDQRGSPFLIIGDAAWEVTQNLSSSEPISYITARVSRRFNAVLVDAITHKFTVGKPSRNVAGHLPFTRRLDGASYTGTPNGTTSAGGTSGQFPAEPHANISAQAPDFTYPNASYFSSLDAFLSLCQQNGVLVFLFPIISAGGLADQSYANSARSKLWNHGAWLAHRYRAYTNIVWVHGGAGIRSVAGPASVLHTGHFARPGLSTDVSLSAGSFDEDAHHSRRRHGQPAERRLCRGCRHSRRHAAPRLHPPAHAGTITDDMNAMAQRGSSLARWFNPATGELTTIGTFPNSGTRVFVTPGGNGSGHGDWVLFLDGAPVPTSPGLAVRINFQTTTAATPSGYLSDIGLAFGNHGNGQSYGWNADNTAQARAGRGQLPRHALRHPGSLPEPRKPEPLLGDRAPEREVHAARRVRRSQLQ